MFYNESLVNTATELERKHIPFHFGDETLIERHGRVEGNKFIIGEMKYTTVVLPEYIKFMPKTQKLLDEFKNNGGIITTVDTLTPSTVVDNPEITYTLREYDNFTVHYRNIVKGKFMYVIFDILNKRIVITLFIGIFLK